MATISGERVRLSATLLADGRVLAAGGNRMGARLATAEIYNPNSGAWVATGSMKEVRDSQSAVRLNDGRVLVAGGSNAITAELYDPVTGIFTLLATWHGAPTSLWCYRTGR